MRARARVEIAYEAGEAAAPATNGLMPSDTLPGCPRDNAAVARAFLPVRVDCGYDPIALLCSN